MTRFPDSRLPPEWRRFLGWRVPTMLLAMLAVGQLLAMTLAHVPLRRSYMDDLALAVERDRTPHRVVLLGDSVTMMATRRFQLGRGAGDVAKLATIAFSGPAAELFLLQRFLAHHPAPDHVLYAFAPDDFGDSPDPRITHYYDWNVYDRPEEHEFLRAHVPGIDARGRLPAVLDVQENFWERLLSLAVRSPPAMPGGARLPDPDVATEPATASRLGDDTARRRAGEALALGGLQRAVLGQLCVLSRQYGFELHLVTPPLPPAVRDAWIASGALATLTTSLHDALAGDCRLGPSFDVNTVRAYSNFDRQGLHVNGPGWEERYAADLSRMIADLPDRPSATSSMTSGTPGGPMLAQRP